MQLIYRGVRYSYAPVIVESDQGALDDKYRGVASKFRNHAAKVPALTPKLDLIYRGARYGYTTTAVESGSNAVVRTQTAYPVDLIYRGASYTSCPA